MNDTCLINNMLVYHHLSTLMTRRWLFEWFSKLAIIQDLMMVNADCPARPVQFFVPNLMMIDKVHVNCSLWQLGSICDRQSEPCLCWWFANKYAGDAQITRGRASFHRNPEMAGLAMTRHSCHVTNPSTLIVLPGLVGGLNHRYASTMKGIERAAAGWWQCLLTTPDHWSSWAMASY